MLAHSGANDRCLSHLDGPCDHAVVFTTPASIAKYDIAPIATADAIAILVHSVGSIGVLNRAHSPGA